MRLLRRSVGLPVTAEQAYSTLHRFQTDTVWLDSGPHARRGTSLVAAGTRLDASDVFGALRALPRAAGPAAPLGVVGWFGYELRGRTTGAEVTHASRYPDAALLWVDRGVLIDHATGRADLIALGEQRGEQRGERPGEDWGDDLEAWAQATREALREPVSVPPWQAPRAKAAWADDREGYLAKVAACLAAIADGAAYQLCLTTEARVPVTPDPLSAYLALRASSPSHHGALLRVGGVSLLSASPETFLTVDADRVVTSRPIKGTRPRGSTEAEDELLRAELLDSPKERAENLMIVDLMRNDLARVGELGSVEVPELLAVESYPHVHQLVSTVRARLREGLTAVDALEACFPAGSMTGAPKRRATEILNRLEGRARGVYSGAFGRLSADGTADLAMVIRSIVLDDAGATVGAGGGVTALSDPEEEWREARLKAAALLRVLGA